MHNYFFDAETNGLLLQADLLNPVACKEPRPVYAEEMVLLGFDSLFDFPRGTGLPLLWNEQSAYFYKGTKIARLNSVESVKIPEIIRLDNIFSTEPLQPCNIAVMVQKNRALIEALAEAAIKRVQHYYEIYKDKSDIIWCSFSGGKDSMVLLDLVQQALPHSAFKVFFTDTRMEFPDTYSYVATIQKWCAERQIEFVVCQSEKLPKETWKEFGPPASGIRWCCSVHKSAPHILKGREITGNVNMRAFSFIGVRASESLARSRDDFLCKSRKHNGEDSLNAILDWNSAEVWLYIYMRSLPINPAYIKGNKRVGCLLCPGATNRSEFITKQCYPSAYNIFHQYIKDAYDPRVTTTGNINDPCLDNIWVARKNGNGLLIPCAYEDIRQEDDWILTCKKLRTDWCEWIKTIGTLQNDKSPYRLKFKSGIYTFSVSEKAHGELEVRTTDQHTKECKSFIKLLKQVFRKAACCVMCRVCEADCPYGCLTMKDGMVHISDKCHHCAGCHKPEMGCHVYHSLQKRRNGRMYFLNHGKKDNENS